jgi:hypothetical protein
MGIPVGIPVLVSDTELAVGVASEGVRGAVARRDQGVMHSGAGGDDGESLERSDRSRRGGVLRVAVAELAVEAPPERPQAP